LVTSLFIYFFCFFQEDRRLNELRQPAIKKLMLLPYAEKMLNKADLQVPFLESNVLSVFTEWLAPMPDKSLPAQKIRTSFLRLLRNVSTFFLNLHVALFLQISLLIYFLPFFFESNSFVVQ
jgi:hypothetical protein